MKITEIKKSIQAILFAAGEPYEAARLSALLQVDEATLHKLVEDINESEAHLPFLILKLNDCYQLTTKEEYASIIKEALESKRNTPLSQAALEVLAVIAYNQPVTKPFVEQVRGIDSSSVVNSLVAKGLVEEAGRLEIPGKPIAYKTTHSFLRCFGMKGIEALPKIPEAAVPA